MIKKCLLLFLSFVCLYYIGYSLIKGSYSSSESIIFNYDLNVDNDNMIIKYLYDGTLVGDLLSKVSSNLSNTEIVIYDINGNVKNNDNVLVSGDKLVLKYINGNSILEYDLSVLGDVDGNGIVDLLDVNKLFEYYRNYSDMNSYYVNAGDVKFDEGDISFDENDINLYVGDEKKINYIIFPDNEKEIKLNDVVKLYQYIKNKINLDYSYDTDLIWENSDDSVITIKDGIVKGIKEGNSIVTVKTANGIKDYLNVSVKKEIIEVDSISLDRINLSMIEGYTTKLNVMITPENASNKTVIWESSDSNVVSVSNGEITALKKGNAVITVKSSNGLIAICNVTVTEGKVEMIEADIDYSVRDPFVLVDNGVYYLYATGWVAYKNTSGNLNGKWERIGVVVNKEEHMIKDYWAPEVYKYGNYYYMFATYKSSVNDHRGTSIFKSDSPTGPFVEISDGHVTPKNIDAIDGTPYLDDSGQPWLIFVYEWTSTDNGVGRIMGAKLSKDLTQLISEPIQLFSAKDAAWAGYIVTDGCFMYENKNEELLMLWSNLDSNDNYAVGIARSITGKIDGTWIHDTLPLYSKDTYGDYDGGHGMIFTDTDGQMYLSIHSPNTSNSSRVEKARFIPIYEENGNLKIIK